MALELGCGKIPDKFQRVWKKRPSVSLDYRDIEVKDFSSDDTV